HPRVTGPGVVPTFREAVRSFGVPASTLTDNGMVFTTRFSGGRGGRNGFEAELRRLHVHQKNSRPDHPLLTGVSNPVRALPADDAQLATRPAPPARQPRRAPGPPRSLRLPPQPAAASSLPAPPRHPGRRLPLPAQGAPTTSRELDHHHRVRRDVIDKEGKVTLRHGGRLFHIGVGRTHARTPVVML